MTEKQEAALRLAADAIDEFCELGAIIRPLEVRDAIDEALAEQPAQQGCMRCNTPKKCALYGCSPLTWPAEQPAQRTFDERVYLAMVAISNASFGEIQPTFEEMKAAIEAADGKLREKNA